MDVSELVRQEVYRLFAKYPSYVVKVVGHSLGGAIALFASVDLFQELDIPASKMSLVTFGEPRTGNLQWSRYIDEIEYSQNIYRVTSIQDVGNKLYFSAPEVAWSANECV